MAIFHLSTKPISRSSGRSSTASAAYRAACKIEDSRTGLTHDYSKKKGVVFSQCLIIGGEYDEVEEIDRNDLWNIAEKSEKRKDARTAREIVVNLPHELSDQVRATIVYDFAVYLMQEYNVAIDYAIHRPDENGDNRNHHAHIMMTTRAATYENNEIRLGDKTRLELSNTKLNSLELPKTQTQIKQIRKMWADIVNVFSKAENHIDHRSFAERGIDRKPSVKVGWKMSGLERKGVKTKKGDINRLIDFDNRKIDKLSVNIKELKAELYEEVRKEITSKITYNLERKYILANEKLDDDNQHKLDNRQTELLRDFKKNNGLDKKFDGNIQTENWIDYRKRISEYVRDSNNLEHNKHIVDMLRNPQAEREQHKQEQDLVKSVVDVEPVQAVSKNNARSFRM